MSERTDALDAGLTAPFKSNTVWICIDLMHDVEGGECMDNDALYEDAYEWLRGVDAEELKDMILNECMFQLERWE